MPRDKFAAMAANAGAAGNQHQQNQESAAPETAPKRDKFAAINARQQQQQQQQQQLSGSSAEATAPVATSPPKRDKMAALAARSEQQQQQQPQTRPLVVEASPKRDKFAAINARQQQQQQQQPIGSPIANTIATSPPKRDKMAALAARSNSPPKRDKMAALAARSNAAGGGEHQQQETPAPGTSPGPKRDKMAALNARQNNASPVENSSLAEDPKDATMAIESPPRRDKLAAMASRSMNSTADAAPASSRNSKLARLVASGTTGGGTSEVNTKSRDEIAAEAAAAREKHLAKLKERLSKRKGMLDSLDRAETLTCRLLKIAAQTTEALQDLNFSSNLSRLSTAYRATLQELHPLLTVGTEDLIKPYQNHTEETKQSMYAARVEMRLAKERLDVLKTFTELEREEKKEAEAAAATADPNGNPTTDGDESGRKRKR